jgi:hypothetical protein
MVSKDHNKAQSMHWPCDMQMMELRSSQRCNTGKAQKPQLWLGLRQLWLSQDLGWAKALTHLAQLGPSCGFWHTISY